MVIGPRGSRFQLETRERSPSQRLSRNALLLSQPARPPAPSKGRPRQNEVSLRRRRRRGSGLHPSSHRRTIRIRHPDSRLDRTVPPTSSSGCSSAAPSAKR